MPNNTETIVFGGGCFWCVEAIFQMLKGVESVTSGYAGGDMPNPSYEQVSRQRTGHAEVVRVVFDPSVVTLETLLAVFFTSHDPTTVNRQGGDVGEQYRSAVYYTDEAQKLVIESFIKKLTDDKTFSKPIVTEVKPLGAFYEAEGYHQNYYENNQDAPYCQAVIDPKIVKLRKTFAHLLKAE
jgi:peptide-methionine (S)-S-oxide reductase